MLIDVGVRFDLFQNDAVTNILNDFQEKLSGRYLLVIPTGGGKTFTAVKAINKMFQVGILDFKSDIVVWAAHRQELITQAETTFDKFEEKNCSSTSSKDCVNIMMISKVKGFLKDHQNVKIIVIDEAHHAATRNVSYGPIFEYPHLGILGLTATPSRHDGEPLEFDRESYSIGFPDLVEKQIILSPQIRTLKGGRFDNIKAKGARFKGLEQLGTKERDGKIIQHIIKYHQDYNKIIIYAASVKHTYKLCERMIASRLSDLYESIEYITGSKYSGNEERDDFIARIKKYNRSIIVNHDVLSEGYDDPKVNTIIMARPSKSKLVYMQAIGRGIRVNQDDPSKKAFIVEVVDDLPNIRYRINNRWLFSDISDTLEPSVIDEFFGSAEEFQAALEKIYHEYNVSRANLHYPKWKKSVRYSLLLFRSYIGNKKYQHIPIVIDNDNRSHVSNWYNFLSERIEKYRSNGINIDRIIQPTKYQHIQTFENSKNRRLIYDSMEEASKVACSDQIPNESKASWITFVALRYRQIKLSDEIEEFISGMVNRNQIEVQIKEKNYQTGDKVVRFPLPLSSYVGQIVTNHEFIKLREIVNSLKELKDLKGNGDHRNSVRELLDQSILPIDMIYRDALPLIVREDQPYYLLLE